MFSPILFGPISPSIQSAYAENPYSHTNSKGKTYYLYSKEVQLKNSDKTRIIYYFSKDSENKKGKALAEVPKNKVVSETKNGLPVLKNK